MSRIEKLTHVLCHSQYPMVRAWRPFTKYPCLRKKPYWGNHFQAKEYCVDTVGVDAEIIRKYLTYQEMRRRRQKEMDFRKQ